jgi:hypothetical protein
LAGGPLEGAGEVVNDVADGAGEVIDNIGSAGEDAWDEKSPVGFRLPKVAKSAFSAHSPTRAGEDTLRPSSRAFSWVLSFQEDLNIGNSISGNPINRKHSF